MTNKDLSELTDQELLAQAKEMKSAAIMHAVIIGFLMGIVIYSVATNSWGFLTLIPLYLAFRVFHKPENNKRHEAVKELIKERKLS
ncbi:hypothetical protein [Neolewinella persica]|uniref:hypothetical protein n=1 Tax=Neolewinella persica TaxID=70998 RepID=UPI0003778050|nr:hypothetical protein [Neolewinella persica]